MVALFIVILFAVLFITKAIKRSNLSMGSASWLKVLDRQTLGGQHALYLVEIAGNLQVLAGSGQGLVKIMDIENPDVAAEILADISQRLAVPSSGVLPQLLEKITGLKQRGKRDFTTEFDQVLREAKDDDIY
ncbi:MAG TPA: flagellar biosynthetic protein FliO [Desulfobacteria bacterium]|nr:flagellar biosynthetic protein FliO [Desulfobacteria bacterium]